MEQGASLGCRLNDVQGAVQACVVSPFSVYTPHTHTHTHKHINTHKHVHTPRSHLILADPRSRVMQTQSPINGRRIVTRSWKPPLTAHSHLKASAWLIFRALIRPSTVFRVQIRTECTHPHGIEKQTQNTAWHNHLFWFQLG